jgi:hypothetical protein
MITLPITIATSGDNSVIAAVTGKRYKVYKLFLVATGTVSIQINNGASKNLIGVIPLLASGTFTHDAHGHVKEALVTDTGNAFIINLSAAVSVTGYCQYEKLPK